MAQAISKGPTTSNPYWEDCGTGCNQCGYGGCSSCNSPSKNRPSVHHGADKSGNDIAMWNPSNAGADEAILSERDDLAARSKDLIRNTGIATSGMNAHDDNIIGAHFRYSPKPLYKYLDWTHEEAHDFIQQAKCLWRMDTESSNRWFDAGGKKTPTQILSQQYRTYMSHGDGTSAVEFLETRPSPFKTAINVFDPLRIQTPDKFQDSPYVRQGIRINRFNNPLGYFVFVNHPYDSLCSSTTDDKYVDSYKYVKSRTPWGRPNIIHSYDQHYPHQTRGVPMFTAALKRLKMLDRWETNTLDAAIAQSMYAATIESDMPDAMDAAGMGGPLSQHSPSAQYFGEASQYLDKTNIYFDGVKVNRLYPGEKFKLNNPSQPIQSFDSFEWAMLRHVAVALGVSPEELAGDYSKVNYNGARSSSIKSWRHYMGQRVRICTHAANIMVECWMEEQISNGRLRLPSKIPQGTSRQRLNYFLENKQALVNAEWFGQGMGHIDPLKGTKAAEIEFKLRQLTGERYQNGVHGEDWDDLQERLIYEDVVKAKNRMDARERAEELGCLNEFDELNQLSNEAESSADKMADALLMAEGQEVQESGKE